MALDGNAHSIGAIEDISGQPDGIGWEPFENLKDWYPGKYLGPVLVEEETGASLKGWGTWLAAGLGLLVVGGAAWWLWGR